MKKSSGSHLKRNNVNALRHQLSLLMIKFSKDIDLKESELTFFIKTLYHKLVKKIHPDLPDI